MPIAIYRHMKLALAVHKPSDAIVGLRHMASCTSDTPEDGGVGVRDIPLIEVVFKSQTRRHSSCVPFVHKTTWRFNARQFSIEQGYCRGNISLTPTSSIIPPLLNVIWTAQRRDDYVTTAMERYSTRSIIELYLHEFELDAENYRIGIFDFNPNRDLNKPYAVSHAVRDLESCRAASVTDKSESPEEWIALFMGEQ